MTSFFTSAEPAQSPPPSSTIPSPLSMSRQVRDASAVGDDAERRSRVSRRGFASMTPERRREIARMGGKAAHESGAAHQWNSAEAKDAGRKGGISKNKRFKAAAAGENNT